MVPSLSSNALKTTFLNETSTQVNREDLIQKIFGTSLAHSSFLNDEDLKQKLETKKIEIWASESWIDTLLRAIYFLFGWDYREEVEIACDTLLEELASHSTPSTPRNDSQSDPSEQDENLERLQEVLQDIEKPLETSFSFVDNKPDFEIWVNEWNRWTKNPNEKSCEDFTKELAQFTDEDQAKAREFFSKKYQDTVAQLRNKQHQASLLDSMIDRFPNESFYKEEKAKAALDRINILDRMHHIEELAPINKDDSVFLEDEDASFIHCDDDEEKRSEIVMPYFEAQLAAARLLLDPKKFPLDPKLDEKKINAIEQELTPEEKKIVDDSIKSFLYQTIRKTLDEIEAKQNQLNGLLKTPPQKEKHPTVISKHKSTILVSQTEEKKRLETAYKILNLYKKATQ